MSVLDNWCYLHGIRKNRNVEAVLEVRESISNALHVNDFS
jgi:hypothetical protein